MALLQYMVGDRGGRTFALPLVEVVRVSMSPRIVESPMMPVGYVGVIDFEGDAVPVWDPFPESGDAMWGATVIVADTPKGRVGFLSDAPPRVAGASGDAAEPAEVEGPMWNAAVTIGGSSVPVLSPSRF